MRRASLSTHHEERNAHASVRSRGGKETRTRIEQIKFTVPEQILFFNADAGSLRPSTVSIEDAGPAVTV